MTQQIKMIFAQYRADQYKTLTAVINVKCYIVRLHLDRTTQSNTVQKKYVLEKQVHSSATTIREYDRAPLKTLG